MRVLHSAHLTLPVELGQLQADELRHNVPVSLRLQAAPAPLQARLHTPLSTPVHDSVPAGLPAPGLTPLFALLISPQFEFDQFCL